MLQNISIAGFPLDLRICSWIPRFPWIFRLSSAVPVSFSTHFQWCLPRRSFLLSMLATLLPPLCLLRWRLRLADLAPVVRYDRHDDTTTRARRRWCQDASVLFLFTYYWLQGLFIYLMKLCFVMIFLVLVIVVWYFLYDMQWCEPSVERLRDNRKIILPCILFKTHAREFS